MFLFPRRTQRTIVSHKDFGLTNSKTHLGFVQNLVFIVRLISSSLALENRSVETKENGQKLSFIVSYFMNSCRLSAKSALAASKKVSIKNTEGADSVLRLLGNHGFTNLQISKVVRVCPQIIALNCERNLLPKIEFFGSIGVLSDDLPKLISSTPHLLAVSLKNRLSPNYNFLKNIVFLDEVVVRVMKGMKWAFLCDFSSNLAPNIAFLREIGVPASNISNFVISNPCGASITPSKFCEIVNKVKTMGFNPLRRMFLKAIEVISQMTKLNWESKIEVYRRWGWSKDETLNAFRRHPYCMRISEEKITKTMDFFVNKMGWLSQDIAKRPEILLYSLEKRIVPRCSVVQVLLSRGLIKKDLCPCSLLVLGETQFKKSYVTKFQVKVPQLLNLYEEEMNLLDVRPGFERYVE